MSALTLSERRAILLAAEAIARGEMPKAAGGVALTPELFERAARLAERRNKHGYAEGYGDTP